MTTPTNWPNPERPGVPLFPERDGKHVICTDPEGDGEFVYSWLATHQVWVEYDHEGPENALEGYDLIGWVYVGPVLTPAQIAEILAGERERTAQEAIRIGESWNGTELSPTNTARTIAHAIRNLGDAP
ncbi:hypothetical protein [Acetobacter okinawensis]|uniref:hypothetical protein n=1 Tax=Acetobacter okinawensis TaxID=1076594 RepID=UPI0039E9A2F5